MKTILCLLVVVVCGLNLLADDSAQKKEPKSPLSAQVEAIAKTLTFSQRSKLLDLLNHGDDTALLGVPGIGETRAAAIKRARPYGDVTEVVKIDGIGAGTFSDMVAHARAGFPKKPKRSTPKKKAPPEAIVKRPSIAAFRFPRLGPAGTTDVPPLQKR